MLKNCRLNNFLTALIFAAVFILNAILFPQIAEPRPAHRYRICTRRSLHERHRSIIRTELQHAAGGKCTGTGHTAIFPA